MSDDGWTVVGKDGKARLPANLGVGSDPEVQESDVSEGDSVTSTEAGCLDRMLRLRNQIKASAFYSSLRAAVCQTGGQHADFVQIAMPQPLDFKKSECTCAGFPWSSVRSIRCYGLGRPTKSLESRCQLALLALLPELIGVARCPCLVYDPVLAAIDVAVLQHLGLTQLSQDEAEVHTVSEPTLFYMPHCESILYSDVLDQNWSVEKLLNVAILGNSFQHMEVRVLL
jgi:hypothetical protein